MPTDRAVPLTAQQFCAAIAQIESGNRSNAPLGDDGRARGRYQLHPDFFYEWLVKLNIQPLLGETWDSLDTRLLVGYFNVRIGQGMTPIQAGVSFHNGHPCRETDSDWNDENYPTRFERAAASLG